jgi:hypothetical protein
MKSEDSSRLQELVKTNLIERGYRVFNPHQLPIADMHTAFTFYACKRVEGVPSEKLVHVQDFSEARTKSRLVEAVYSLGEAKTKIELVTLNQQIRADSPGMELILFGANVSPSVNNDFAAYFSDTKRKDYQEGTRVSVEYQKNGILTARCASPSIHDVVKARTGRFQFA